MLIYSLYIGDNYIADGTALELAAKMGVKRTTVYFWSSPSYVKRSKYNKRKILIKLEGDGE